MRFSDYSGWISKTKNLVLGRTFVWRGAALKTRLKRRQRWGSPSYKGQIYSLRAAFGYAGGPTEAARVACKSGTMVPVTTSLLLAPAIQRGPWPWKQVGLPFWFSFLITWSVERGYWKQRPSCAHWQFKHNEDKEPQTQEGSGFNLRCLPSSFIIWKRASSNNGQRNNKMNGFPPLPTS